MGTRACGLKTAALGLQVFPQQTHPAMLRKTCGNKATKEVQGLVWQVAAVLSLGLQVFPQRARPTMPRETCGSLIFRTALQVQGI